MNIQIIYGDDLRNFPTLRNQMLRDRGAQFRDILGWDLNVDENGLETDSYDDLNPLYIIVTGENGEHVASTRILPTTGPTMLADHFSHLTDGVAISTSLAWEVTRFFVANRAIRRAAPALMWAGCRLARKAGVKNYVSVTGADLLRIFAACGWAAEVVGRADSPEGEICACHWPVSEELEARLARRAGVDPDRVDLTPVRAAGAVSNFGAAATAAQSPVFAAAV